MLLPSISSLALSRAAGDLAPLSLSAHNKTFPMAAASAPGREQASDSPGCAQQSGTQRGATPRARAQPGGEGARRRPSDIWLRGWRRRGGAGRGEHLRLLAGASRSPGCLTTASPRRCCRRGSARARRLEGERGLTCRGGMFPAFRMQNAVALPSSEPWSPGTPSQARSAAAAAAAPAPPHCRALQTWHVGLLPALLRGPGT